MTSAGDLEQSSGTGVLNGTLSHSHGEQEPSRTAVLLIAHGSRRAEANDDLTELARLLQQRTAYAAIVPGYLELAEPSVIAAGARCVANGTRRVLMFPYFLSAGRHVVEDLESLRQELGDRHPGVEFQLCPPLGRHPLMIEIVLDRLAERLPVAE